MSSRRNFLDADNSIMEKNLRFVKNDLEENLNQYFGGSVDRRNSAVSAPPRDYKVVEPKPGGSHAHKESNGLEQRRKFLLQLGLARHEAYELAKNTNFDINYLEQKCHEYFVRGVPQDEVNSRVLYNIRKQIGNTTHQEQEISRKTPPTEFISTFYNENDRRECKDRENRSRSRSRCYALSRYDQREERYQHERSISPNIGFSTLRERKNYQSEERYQPEICLSPNRGFSTLQERNDEYFLKQFNTRDEVRRETMPERSHFRSYSPTRIDRSSRSNRELNLMQGRRGDECLLSPDSYRDEITKSTRKNSQSYSPVRIDRTRREDYYHSSRSRSPNGVVNERGIGRYINNTNMDATRRGSSQQSRSRAYSPVRNVRREERYHSPRSRSPNKGFTSRSEKRYEGFYLQDDDNFRDEIRRDSIRSRSRSFSPPRINRREEVYKSPETTTLNNIDFEYQQGRNHSRTLCKQNQSTQNLNIPSLLSLDVFPNHRQSSEVNFQNQNIPSLLSLKVSHIHNELQQPMPSNIKLKQRDNKNQIKSAGKVKTQQIEKKSDINNRQLVLKQNIAYIPIIKSGLANPPAGHLKANPREYWSQWWPYFKYIEYSIPKINPHDYEIKTCLNFLLKPNSVEYRKRRHLLLNKAVKTIMKTEDIDETNYYVRDIFKLFQYKKHLEDPNFQNSLTPEQLNCIAPALRQFKKKVKMAFLHQALIVRWHISLDIIKKVQAGEPLLSNYAKILLSEKSFHYLVMESIQELKKMCQQDWSQFNEFYKNIKAKKVDIYSFGAGPCMKVKTNKI